MRPIPDLPRCPACHSPKTVKRGFRTVKQGRRQLFCCKKCHKIFSSSALPNYSYPAPAVLAAAMYYYRGYSLERTRQRIIGRYRVHPGSATVYAWIKKFGKFSGLKDHLAAIRTFSPPHKLIWRKVLYHNQTYFTQIHLYKLRFFTGAVPGVAAYLHQLVAGAADIDHTRFRLRASELVLPVRFPRPEKRHNYACRIAGLAMRSAESNYQRHNALQSFFLATDKTTIAAEVPVYLNDSETKWILRKEGGLLGHIDFLQVAGRRVFLLDYKPSAEKETMPQTQLLLYAIALSRRTGVHLKDIFCAWFDENAFYSFPALAGYAQLKKSCYSRGRNQ